MRQITLTDAASQQINIIGDNGEVIPFLINFLPTQNGWFFNIEYNDFILNGVYLTLSPNCLRGYRNVLPFGLLCTSVDGYEPQFASDFIDGRISLYLLNADEVAEVELTFYSPDA